MCRLKKAIYGLKQASRTWNEKLHKTLLGHGFKRTRLDAGVYVYEHDLAEMILIVYVDDLLPMGPGLTEIKRIKQVLADQFQIRDLGPATSFLGMRITRDRSKKHYSATRLVLREKPLKLELRYESLCCPTSLVAPHLDGNCLMRSAESAT